MAAEPPKRVSIVRRTRFSAAHFLWLDHLSEEENRRRFGPTSNRHAHGHNYDLEMTVSGPLDPETGMVVNLKDLKVVLEEEVLTPLDFKNLNHEVPFFQGKIPILETLMLFLWPRLEARMNALSLKLEKLKLWELEDLYVEYDGVPN